MSGRGQAVAAKGSQQTQFILSIFLPGLIGQTGTDITNNWFRVPAGGLDLSTATIHIVMRIAAGTTDPKWDLMKSTDGGSSFTSILGGSKILATHGQKVTDIASPSWSGATLAEGDLLRVDLITTDDGTGAYTEITIVPPSP